MRDARRQDFPRRFTVRGGLLSVAEARAGASGVGGTAGRRATTVSTDGGRFSVTTARRETHEAGVAARAAKVGEADRGSLSLPQEALPRPGTSSLPDGQDAA